VAVLIILFAGCSRDPIRVEAQDTGGDFGMAKLNEAVVAAGRDRESPEAFNTLAETIEKLRVLFNQPVGELAERKLVFLAVHPIRVYLKRTPAERLAALSLTVWPTALKVHPAAGETPYSYLLRICANELAMVCRGVVPEQWSVVVGREVISRLRNRARDAFASCDACKHDASYQQTLEMYDEEHARADAEYAQVRAEVAPSAWPKAGPHAAPWPNPSPPLLVIREGGEATFRSVKCQDGDWARSVGSQRGDSDTLAVHLWPNERVGLVRSVLRAARAAHYRWVSLQVREANYPYEPREYRLALRGTGPRVQARDSDTVQVLVQFLDSATNRGGTPNARMELLLGGL
jgi:hypothetical protein